MNNKTLQNPSAAKYLFYKGYSGKHIAIILGCSLSSAYHYIHDPKVVATDEKLTQSQQLIRYCIDKFRAYTGISTPCFNDDDRIYLQIIRFLGANKDQIYKLYWNCPFRYVTYALHNKKLRWVDFNEKLVGLTRTEYIKFLRAVKKFSELSKIPVVK